MKEPLRSTLRPVPAAITAVGSPSIAPDHRRSTTTSHPKAAKASMITPMNVYEDMAAAVHASRRSPTAQRFRAPLYAKKDPKSPSGNHATRHTMGSTPKNATAEARHRKPITSMAPTLAMLGLRPVPNRNGDHQ